MSSFGLPPLPLPLKSISPYLQRAAELHQKDPVIAYWCAYYAAQVGISLKAKDNASRTLLLELLDVLEKLKREIGPNDAIDTESVSAAYVENFALRVFSVADDEDRSGNSTRSTAKKFLAAANFLEILKTFPKTELTEATEGKIRYSKWKAADIAKAFREGRKPTPGAAGEQSSQPVLELSEQPFTPPRTLLGVNPHTLEPTSPGNWSTAATPGAGTVQGTPTDDSPMPSAFTGNSWPPESPTPNTRNQNRRGSQSSAGSTDSAQSFGLGGIERQRANMSPRKVHFSTDTTSIHPPSANVALFPSDAITPSFTFQAPPPLSVPNTILPLIPPPIVSQEVELTPAVVAKAQKHCRFAISALDYEDAEQAKKELRAALTALGG
ncbi:DUF605-domain-containing protein [Lentinula edodes]|nr:DUF605-domain-containing protein [Lentinula edodes]